MSAQPEALRLADWCDANSSGDYRPSAEAADELRRLHTANADLLAALKKVLRFCVSEDGFPEAKLRTVEQQEAYDDARAAIAKSEGSQ